MAVLGITTTKTSQNVRDISKLTLDLREITDDNVPNAAVQHKNKNTSSRNANVSINMADVKATLWEKRTIRILNTIPKIAITIVVIIALTYLPKSTVALGIELDNVKARVPVSFSPEIVSNVKSSTVKLKITDAIKDQFNS